jgi:putative FmdB family regulatory protein
MPVYEYQCKACGRDFEYQQRMSDPDKTTCEVCGGALDRLISRTAFALKGGGWYKDLYASPKPEGGDAGKASNKAEGGGDAKTDGKAADKPAAKSGESAGAADKPAAKPSSDSGGSSSGSSGSGGGGSSGGASGGSSGSVTKAS